MFQHVFVPDVEELKTSKTRTLLQLCKETHTPTHPDRDVLVDTLCRRFCDDATKEVLLVMRGTDVVDMKSEALASAFRETVVGECPICLQSYETNEMVVVLPCGHHFHKTCACRWLRDELREKRTYPSCPTCRRGIDETTPRVQEAIRSLKRKRGVCMSHDSEDEEEKRVEDVTEGGATE